MSRPRHAESWQHTPSTYRRRALTHSAQAAAFVLPFIIVVIPVLLGGLTRSWVAAVLAVLACELTLLLVAPHVAGFRKLVDDRFHAAACLRAGVVRATLLSRMGDAHRYELERLEDSVARVRAVAACDSRDGDDWLGLDNLLAVFVRLAIAHRESIAAFDAGGPRQLEDQIRELTAPANGVGAASLWGARRVAILRERLEASRQASYEQAVLLEQLATIAETIRWTFEQASLGWSSDAQAGVEEAIAHCAGNGGALRELAALRGEAPIDGETLRLGRLRLAVAAKPSVRVELEPHSFLAEALNERLLVAEPTVNPIGCSASHAEQYVVLPPVGRSRAA